MHFCRPHTKAICKVTWLVMWLSWWCMSFNHWPYGFMQIRDITTLNVPLNLSRSTCAFYVSSLSSFSSFSSLPPPRWPLHPHCYRWSQDDLAAKTMHTKTEKYQLIKNILFGLHITCAYGKGLTFLLAPLGSGCAAAGGVVGGEASLQESIRMGIIIASLTGREWSGFLAAYLSGSCLIANSSFIATGVSSKILPNLPSFPSAINCFFLRA